ncbi:hypothetical protein F01_480321 [Burkholderia cenocepacia]|nr:hypothetical protein F01_480321 [Burkholderia cenocepacia]
MIMGARDAVTEQRVWSVGWHVSTACAPGTGLAARLHGVLGCLREQRPVLRCVRQDAHAASERTVSITSSATRATPGFLRHFFLRRLPARS